MFFPWKNKYKNCKHVEISIRLGLWKVSENGGHEETHIILRIHRNISMKHVCSKLKQKSH
jgi:hypothetical protein